MVDGWWDVYVLSDCKEELDGVGDIWVLASMKVQFVNIE